MFNNIPEELRLIHQWVILIQERFRYDPLTGKVFYRERKLDNNASPRHKQWNTRFANKEVKGWINEGYIRISLDDKEIYLHQVAFACVKGFIPIEVDHEDLDKTNNRWENLREADRLTNSTNNFQRRNNKTGLKGVSWSKWNNKWRMDIQHNKIKYHSFHDTKEEAYNEYCLKSAELHREFGNVK